MATTPVFVVPIVVPVVPGRVLVIVVGPSVEVVVEGEGFLQGVADAAQQIPLFVIGFVEVSFAVEIVQFVLKFGLSDINTALISLLQVVSQFLDKTFDATSAIAGKLHTKVQSHFP